MFVTSVSSMSEAAAAPSVSTQVVLRQTIELEVIFTLKAQNMTIGSELFSFNVSFYMTKHGLKGKSGTDYGNLIRNFFIFIFFRILLQILILASWFNWKTMALPESA